MSGLFIKKNLAELLGEGEAEGEGEPGPRLKRTLGAFNLTMLGIGATIGAGIFTLTGEAAAGYAGPGIIYSFMLGGLLCTLAGLCYAEMAAMIPVSGSAYTYSYATMGEFVAWIIGWDLILEYAFGAVAVANGWSSYLYSLLHKTLGLVLADSLLPWTRGPWETVTLASGQVVPGQWNLPATLVVLALAAVLYRGIHESASVNNVIVALKVAIVVLFVAMGLGVVSAANLHANPGASGLASLVPAQELVLEGGRSVHRFGWLRGGVITGAGVVFFAFIGFDAVSTTAQEARRPQRDMPIGILTSLLVCTLLYILVALTLTGVVSYRELAVSDPIAVGVDRIVALRGWSQVARTSFAFAVKLGALAGLSSVMLVIMMAQTRIFYAMSRDGLLPWFHRVHGRNRVPHVATVVTGLLVATGAGLMPMALVGKLVSIGTLLAFLLVCIGVPLLRVTQPDVPRPFRVPGPWLVGLAGAAACLWLMLSLDQGTWLRLLLWLGLGLVVYFSYGRRHSRLQLAAAGPGYGPLRQDLGGLGLVLLAAGGLIWSLSHLGHLGEGAGTAPVLALAMAGLPDSQAPIAFLMLAVLCLGAAGLGIYRVLSNHR